MPDDSPAMVVLSALAAESGEDARTHFAKQLSSLEYLTVSFERDDSPKLQLELKDMALFCEERPDKKGDLVHTALEVVSVKPGAGHPDGAKVLTVTTKEVVVSPANGVESDTYRLFVWREALAAASTSDYLYGTLRLVDSLENAEKERASTQRTKFVGAKEYWRCRNCRAFWRPHEQDRCASCGREFTADDWERPELGKVEFSVPQGEEMSITADAAVLVEPDDESNFVGRVSRIDHRRRIVEVTCRSFEHAGTSGYIAPSYNKPLYAAKRSVLAGIATRDYSFGLLAQMMASPETIAAPSAAAPPQDKWLSDRMIPNPPQDRAVAMLTNLGAGQAVFIQGPPGTGKTTVIVEAVKRRLAKNPDERILVTSHSNLAVDNALERLDGTPNMRGVRVARAERVFAGVDKYRVDGEDDPRLVDANVFFATCATAGTSEITDMNFDIVILDEANKARVDEALPALRLGRAIAMVGDHKQLPPVEDDSLYSIAEDPSIELLINQSLFEKIWEGGLGENAKCLLTIQHRMHPQISKYISDASYEGLLEDAPEVKQYDFVTRWPLPAAMHFVDTKGMRRARERRGPGGAIVNDAEILVALQVARLLDERCPREMSLAIIAMYAEQVERLRHALGRRTFKRTVKIDTVDAFEGREEDMVVISLVRNNERGRIGFLRVPNRLNVAISRARHLVACIGDSQTLISGEESMYGMLVNSATQAGGYIQAIEFVQEKRPRRRGRGGPRPQGAEGQAQPQSQPRPPLQPVLGPDGQPLPPDQQPQRKRRRRRKRGRGNRPLGQPGQPGQTGQPGQAATGDLPAGPQHFDPQRNKWHFEPGQTGGVVPPPPVPPSQTDSPPPMAAEG